MPGWRPIDSGLSTHLPFTPAVEATGFVFVSGQASVDAKGTIIPGTFEEEMHRSIENAIRVLSDAGLTLADVVRVTSYLRDSNDGSQYNEIYRDYFSAPLPARTTVSNCLSPALRFEIDVIAVRP
jgi:2-iminobutanoate/2-iminopropanoate deaminase